MNHDVPVQSLIDHIRTAVDVDPWAKEMAEELLKEQPEIVRCKDCVYCIKEPNGELYCDILAIGYEPLGSKKVTADWFCADGERRTDDA